MAAGQSSVVILPRYLLWALLKQKRCSPPCFAPVVWRARWMPTQP